LVRYFDAVAGAAPRALPPGAFHTVPRFLHATFPNHSCRQLASSPPKQ
jgi:hypothetical protein